jgi:hypothetical protein
LYQASESPPKPLSNSTVIGPRPEQRKFSRRPSGRRASVPGRAAVSESGTVAPRPAVADARARIADHVASFDFAVRALVL